MMFSAMLLAAVECCVVGSQKKSTMPPWAAALGGLALCCGLAAGAVRLSRRRKLRDRLLGAAVVCAVLTVFRLNYNYLASSSPLLLRTENPPPKVFVLSGQSNMAGRGGLVRKNGQARKVFDSSALEHEFERDLVRSSAHHDAKVERLTADMQWVPGTLVKHLSHHTSYTNPANQLLNPCTWTLTRPSRAVSGRG